MKLNKTRVGGLVLLSFAIIPLMFDVGDLFSASEASAAGKVKWVTFDEGMQLSKQTGKKLLIDVYTDWCTWCKKMDSDTYAAAVVQMAIEAKFVPVKLNAESGKTLTYQGAIMTETQFSRSAGVTGYPATLFLDESQKPITLVPGYIPAERFAAILNYIGQDHYRSISFQDYLLRNGIKP